LVEVRKERYSTVDLLVGIGNDLLGDDGVGPYIAENLLGSDWSVINAGIVPENFTRTIREMRPDQIVVIDAIHMDLPPGSVRIIPPDVIRDYGIGTHQLPLTFFIEHCAILSSVVLIGIQPGCLDFDTVLTPPVLCAATKLIAILKERRLCDIPVLGIKEKRE